MGCWGGSVGHHSEIHLKFKSRQLSLLHNVLCSCLIVFNFSQITILLSCSDYWHGNYRKNRYSIKFEFKMRLIGISYIVHSLKRHREVKYMKNTWYLKYYLKWWLMRNACHGISPDRLIIYILLYSKTQLVNQRKQKVAFNPGTAHSPEIQSYRMWWGAASVHTWCMYIYVL